MKNLTEQEKMIEFMKSIRDKIDNFIEQETKDNTFDTVFGIFTC